MASPVKAFTQALTDAGKTFQRRLFVLRGEAEPVFSALAQCLSSVPAEWLKNALWAGGSEQLPLSGLTGITAIEPHKANQWLGTSRKLVIINAHAGFNPDAVAALAGTIEGGGLMIILAPELVPWLSNKDPDYQRMLVYPQQLSDIECRFTRWLDQQLQPQWGVVSVSLSPSSIAPIEPPQFSDPIDSRHDELPDHSHLKQASRLQTELVSQIVNHMLKGPTALILRADRGRGKSAALGLAAAKLIQKGLQVIVTAPRPESVTTLFSFADMALAQEDEGSATALLNRLQFIAPDELIRHPPKTDIVLVDEAAAIPLPMLTQLLARFPRIVFSSTVHGYEGTGRGFDIRFDKLIQRNGREVQRFELQEPMRWSAGDPLEYWVNQTFLLDAEIEAHDRVSDEQLANAKIRPISQDQLFADHALLTAVYALLIQAHYRTTPGDLRDLLDGDLTLWVQEIPGAQSTPSVVGVMLLAKEGELPEDLTQQIWAGRRRPRGHLLPQYLVAQAGYPEVARLACLRVVRIAVHPQLQARGLGSQLLTSLEQIARQQQVELIGAMFAASADLLEFWQDNDFALLRLGVSRDASSGCYTAIIAKPVTTQAAQLCGCIQQDFSTLLYRQISTVWRDLEADLLQSALRQLPSVALSVQQLRDVATFVFAFRGFDQVCSALSFLVIDYLSDSNTDQLSAIDLQLLVSEVLQYDALDLGCFSRGDAAALQGRKARHQRIKQLLRDHLTELLEDRGLGSMIIELAAK